MDFGINQGLVEEQYLRYRDNPRAVDESWRHYFEAMTVADKAKLLRSAALPPPPNGGVHVQEVHLNGNGRSNGNGRGHDSEEVIHAYEQAIGAEAASAGGQKKGPGRRAKAPPGSSTKSGAIQ